MTFKYLGFQNSQNRRLYTFEREATGQPATVLVVSADLALFSLHRVKMQDGPALCARTLAANPLSPGERRLELTGADFRACAAESDAAAEQRAVSRERLHNRPPARRPRSVHSGHWG